MSEWKKYRFSDFVNINPIVKLPKDELISFVEMKDLDTDKRCCLPSQERLLSGGSKFNEGDTLFARITPCLENGKICQVKGLKNRQGFGSTEFHVFRGKTQISDSDFVYYLSRWDDVRSHAEINLDGTSGRQRVPKDAFNDLILTLPSLPEQLAIASVLSSLDNKIDLLHRQNTTLEKMAETLFRQWFVEEATEEWREVELNTIVDIYNGVSYKSTELNPSTTAMVTLKSFDRNGGFKHDGYKEFNGKFKDSHLIESGQIAIAHTDMTQNAEVVGNPIIIPSNHPYQKLLFSMDLVKVLPKDKEVHSTEFLYLLFKNKDFKEHALGYTNGSTVLHLSKKAIPEYTINLPDENRIKEFTLKVKPFFEKKDKNQTQIHTLTQLRDTLLPKLMSGEVRVKIQ